MISPQIKKTMFHSGVHEVAHDGQSWEAPYSHPKFDESFNETSYEEDYPNP